MVVMTADPAVDEAIARVEEQLGVVFNRARLVWKQAAEQIHPDLQPAGYKVLSTITRLGSTMFRSMKLGSSAPSMAFPR